jgi:hypothetical protein
MSAPRGEAAAVLTEVPRLHRRQFTSSVDSTIHRDSRSTSTIHGDSRRYVQQSFPFLPVQLRLKPALPDSLTAPSWRHGQAHPIRKLGCRDQIPVGDHAVLIEDSEREEMGATDVSRIPARVTSSGARAITGAEFELRSSFRIELGRFDLNGDGTARECHIGIRRNPAARIRVRAAIACAQPNHASAELRVGDGPSLHVVPAKLLPRIWRLKLLWVRLQRYELPVRFTPELVLAEETELAFVDVAALGTHRGSRPVPSGRGTLQAVQDR